MFQVCLVFNHLCFFVFTGSICIFQFLSVGFSVAFDFCFSNLCFCIFQFNVGLVFNIHCFVVFTRRIFDFCFKNFCFFMFQFGFVFKNCCITVFACSIFV